MKFKYIVVCSVALLSSCSWVDRQTDDFENWANRTMPTYDDMQKSSPQAGGTTGAYNGYPYNAENPRPTPPAPSKPGDVNTPPLPGYGNPNDIKNVPDDNMRMDNLPQHSNSTSTRPYDAGAAVVPTSPRD